MAAADTIAPGWLSIEGAAVYTGFSVPAIRTAIELGRFPARKVPVTGGRRSPVRIKREHLDAWIEGKPISESSES